jgi:hypothetical protein
MTGTHPGGRLIGHVRVSHQPDECAIAQSGMGGFETLMLSSQRARPTGSSTCVCLDVTICRCPRTEPTGLTGRAWLVTSESNPTWTVKRLKHLQATEKIELVERIS